MWDLPPPDPGFEIVVSSHGMSKGIAQADGIQVIPKAFVQFGTVQVGGQWKNVSSPVADGEGAAFISYMPKLGAYQLTFGAAYKFQTNVTGHTDDDSFEFTGAVSRKYERLTLRISAIYSPDDLGTARKSLYLEGGPSFEIGKSTRLSVNVGHRSREGGAEYLSFNAGIAKTFFKKLTVDLRYYDTNRGELGEIYDNRVVLSGRLAL
jgi:uncharacterized protein (TIGR02001 family)